MAQAARGDNMATQADNAQGIKTIFTRASLLCLIACPAVFATAPLPAEHLSVVTLGPNTPHRVYVFDEALFNEIDSRVHVVDAFTGRLRHVESKVGQTPSFLLTP